MKTIITTLFLFACIVVFANDDKYAEAMKKNIMAVYEAPGIPELQNAVNSLQRIGNAEKTKWEPFYYISFGYIMMATREEDGNKKDSFLDLAKSALAKADELKKGDSEIKALEGFIYMMRVTVDPATRGPQYISMASASYEEALALNPENPRAHALISQMQFGTAQFFKQTPTEACNSARKALALFEQDHGDNALAPHWGKSMTEGLLKNCK